MNNNYFDCGLYNKLGSSREQDHENVLFALFDSELIILPECRW